MWPHFYIMPPNMANEQILYTVADRLATITLNRPDKLNAWTATMEGEVRSAVERAEADDAVRVIVLTGAGRGFCAGADMSLLGAVAKQGVTDQVRERALDKADAAQQEHIRADFQKKYSYFLATKKPVIAAINGPAVGLGLVIALYCDLRFASDAARFSTVFARRGLIAEYGMAWMLPRIVGHSNALDLLFSGRTIDAAEATRMGLANRVLPQEEFINQVYDYARDLASNVSPRSLAVIKRQVYESMFQSLQEAFDLSEREMLASLDSLDFKEGVAHYLEKRSPAFVGR
jgi:enoyl-CoA hydratase/carnithine racemase